MSKGRKTEALESHATATPMNQRGAEGEVLVFNPGPDALCGEYAGRFYDIPVGDSALAREAADHFAGPAGCPGGTFGKRGLRQFGATYTEEQRQCVRLDGARAAYLFCKDHRLSFPDWLHAIAVAVIDGVTDATIPSVAVLNKEVVKPAALLNPKDGETFDPRLHKPQNRPASDAFAEALGFHDGIKDIHLAEPKK